MKRHQPRHGSKGVRPRKRQLSLRPRVRHWPSVEDGPKLLAFPAYKAGMSHVVLIEDHPHSPYRGRERIRPVTILDSPPALIYAVRSYQKTPEGLCALSEAYMKNPPKDTGRRNSLPDGYDPESKLAGMETRLPETAEIRVLAATQPRLTNLPKNTPDFVETKVAGKTVQEQFQFARQLLGKQVQLKEVFKEGEYVDILAITKGKGFQGPVKRFGINVLPRKTRGTKRGVGCIGGRGHPKTMSAIARPGQMGLHQRTTYNLRIIRTGEDGPEVTPRGGFVRYGPVRGQYTMLTGSVSGAKKRLIMVRHPMRPPKVAPTAAPKIVTVSIGSKQGT